MPNTVISSAVMNDDLSDIGTALTGSLARDGQGGMTDVLPLDPTGFVYVNDTNTGMERTGADAQAIVCGGTDIVAVTTSGINVTGAIEQNGLPLLPIGLGPLPWAGATAPTLWLFCFGQSLLRTTYPDLFIAIGTLYGSADSTHFSLPDCRGRVLAGKDDMGGSAAGRLTSATMTPDGITLGAVGGAETNTLTTPQIPSHTHTITDPGHIHNAHINNAIASAHSDGGGGAIAVESAPGNFMGNGKPDSVGSVDSASTGITATNSAGSGGAHNNVQPTIITNYIIFAGV